MTEERNGNNGGWAVALRRLLGREDTVTNRVESTILLAVLHIAAVFGSVMLLGNGGGGSVGALARSLVAAGAVALFLQWLSAIVASGNRRAFCRRQWAWCVFSISMLLVALVGLLVGGPTSLFGSLGLWVTWFGVLRASLKLLRSSFINQRPAVSLILTFGFLIIMGTGVLWLSPRVTVEGAGLSFIDALFTATSATCVTGLEVTSTGRTLTMFGQGVVLTLIQIGGLGIMTLGTFFLLTTGKKLGFQERELVTATMNVGRQGSIRQFVFAVFLVTVGAEALGALAMLPSFADADQPVFTSVFHAVSAFCNAGFSLFDSSFVGRSSDVGLNAVLILLIVLGGLGFVVILEIGKRLLSSESNTRQPITVHTRIVLWSTLILLLVGTVGFYLLEADGVLAHQSSGERWLKSGFQSVSSRTAGFNTVDIGSENKEEGVSSSTRLFLMGLMFVGASPGSTGGGMKTVTIVLLMASVLAVFRNRESVNLFGRRIPDALVKKAGAIAILYGVLVFMSVFILSLTDGGFPLMDLAFEVVSAVGTVGFSVGVSGSDDLSVAGKLVLTGLMYVGRLGPLTIVLMTIHSGRTSQVQVPEERVMIG